MDYWQLVTSGERDVTVFSCVPTEKAPAIVPEPRPHMILGKLSNSQTKQQQNHKNKEETFRNEGKGKMVEVE